MEPPAPTWCHYGFGLDLVSDFRVPQLPVATRASLTSPTRLSRLRADGGDGSWRHPRDEVLVDRRYGDGRLMMGVDRRDGLGYRVWAPGHGRYVVSDDGRHIEAAVGNGPVWKWQRLLFAQVLPLAAALRGLEVFHASAVALGERVFAFAASSGTGKTAAALHLLSRGATLVTDDVLAVSVTESQALAHPGAGVMSVTAPDLAAANQNGGTRLGRVLGRADKLQVSASPIDRPLPLAAIFLLARDSDVARLEIEASPADAGVLLASAFIPYLRTPSYLLSHLDACARLSRLVPMFSVRVPPSADATGVSRALKTHIEGLLADTAA